MAVTLFEDMAERIRRAHHDFDLIYGRTRREREVRYTR